VEPFVDIVTGPREAAPRKNEVGRTITMNETVIETQARSLIEDRIHATHPRPVRRHSRRHRRLRKPSWL
jgi:hypothetical protein